MAYTLVGGVLGGGAGRWGPDLLTILTGYLFLFYGRTASGSFAFGQGLLIDLFSGGPQGLFAFTHLCSFGAIVFGCRFFNLQHPKGQIIIVSLAVLVGRCVFCVTHAVFSEGVSIPVSFLWMSMLSAAGTGVAGPVVFHLLNVIRARSMKDAGGASAQQMYEIEPLPWLWVREAKDDTEKHTEDREPIETIKF